MRNISSICHSYSFNNIPTASIGANRDICSGTDQNRCIFSGLFITYCNVTEHLSKNTYLFVKGFSSGNILTVKIIFRLRFKKIAISDTDYCRILIRRNDPKVPHDMKTRRPTNNILHIFLRSIILCDQRTRYHKQ